MLHKTKKRKYEKLREAEFKVLKEDKMEKPTKKTVHVSRHVHKKEDHKIEEEETKKEEKVGSDSDKYDTEFEDEFDDEYEDEEIIEENPTFIENPMTSEGHKPKKKVEFEKIEVEEDEKENLDSQKPCVKPFLGNSKHLKKDEFLDFDNKAYEMLHRANTEWPCLSFDVLLPDFENYNYRSPSFEKMSNYPYTTYLVSGTQTQGFKNFIYLLKLSNLHKTKHDDDSEEESDGEDSNNDQEADIFQSSVEIKHSVNRVRAMQHSPIVATWNENNEVSIYNLAQKFTQLQAKTSEGKKNKAKNEKNKKKNHLLKNFKHSAEGFALNWSPLKKGVLASGSIDRKIFLYQSADENMSDFVRQDNPYVFHEASVEDIQFSPVEDFVFASCSVDRTIRICDTRENKFNKSQIAIKAHDSDVNVISWNPLKSYLLCSGADDGCFKVWDLRYDKTCMTELLWHNESITSIAFQPNEESVIAVSSADNRISLWDFAVEPDDEGEKDEEIPDQLMFLHQGQEDVKELCFHPIYWEMVISTSNTGFHLFKPNLNDEGNNEEDEGENEDEKGIPKIREEDLDKYLEKMSLN